MTLSIDRRADLWTDRVAAVDDGGTEHSYGDLAALTDGIARRLADAGVGAGDAVAVCARDRLEHLALLFACRRLGAVLAPISYRLGAGAVASLGERIDPALVLYDDEFEELGLAAAGGEGADAAGEAAEEFDAFLEGDAPPTTAPSEAGSRPPGDDVEPAGDEETPLLYVHTGGTTGVPKVVVVSRRQVEWNCITEAAAWGLGKADVAPVLLPFYHTGGWHLLTLPLLYVGGGIVLLREFEPGAALTAIEEHGATRAFAVAAIFQAMAEHDRFEAADLSTLEWCMSGGGPTPDAVIETYRERGVPLVQGYGLTEGGPNNLYFPPERADEPAALDSVGRPFPDCRARLVDPETGEPIGDEEPNAAAEEPPTGELELRGPVTARRYLDTEDGTFEGDWLSTGDLAVRRDGDYEIVGRTDNMFVSGGENVYPEDVEDALEGHPAVAEAGVIGIPHERWGTVPKAVVVPASGPKGGAGADEIDVDALEAYLDERLAGFQVPEAWAVADALPRSGPGKLDREALEREYGEGEERADGGEELADGGGGQADGGDRASEERGDGA